MTRLTVPGPADPDVSIVLVTYGGWPWPLRALEALQDGTDPVYEVVAVDNASPDRTADRLEEEVDGLRLVRNERNEGFAAAAGQGAAEARGDVLCFLNPDALVRPGWLPPLRRAIERPGVGAAVPRFLDPDGRVQEAGSVVDRQGWTEALGAGSDPGDPATRFPRAVDYGSAACLMISREDYGRAGGFDPAYAPAYCEDVDLAFALRQAGLHTMYEPGADVVHAGAGSTDEETRTALIERNRPRLLARWGDELSARPPLGELETYPHRLIALRDALAIERVLVLRDRLPNAEDPVAAFLVEAARGHLGARCTVVALEDRELGGRAGWLLDAGVEVIPGPRDPQAWLDGRRFHYSAVLADAPIWRRLGDAVARSQPQAERLLDVGAGTEGAPQPTAVLAETMDEAREWDDRDRPVFVLADPAATASGLLSWLGGMTTSGR